MASCMEHLICHKLECLAIGATFHEAFLPDTEIRLVKHMGMWGGGASHGG